MKKVLLSLVLLMAFSSLVFCACVENNDNASPSTVIEQPVDLGNHIDFELIRTYSNVGLNDKIRSRVAMATDVASLKSVVKQEAAAEPIFDYFDEEYFEEYNVIFHFWVESPGTVSISATAVYVSSVKITVATLSKYHSGPQPDVVYDYGLKALKVSKADIGSIKTIEELQKYEAVD